MASAVPAEVTSTFRPLRAWIPIVLLPWMIVARFVPQMVQDGPSMIWMVSAFGPFLIGIAILVWWLAISRARWFERLLGLFGIIGVLFLVGAVSDSSMRGPLFTVMTIPMCLAGFAIGAILLSRRLSIQRTFLAILLSLVGASFSALVKTDGVWGDFSFGMDWRWNKSAEEEFLASRPAETNNSPISAADAVAFKKPEWPGFRGPNQDGVQRGLRFSDDWKANPPKELWRVPVGPAWSSFAVAGKFLVTQEQRGETEAVVCYESETGKELWEYTNKSRFFEGLGGLGPRATPTIAEGFVYAMGAEGWLVKLDALNGQPVWKVDLRVDAKRDPPMWGFSSSPLVQEGLVVVHAGGKEDKGILAYNATDGSIAWSAPAGEMSYGSPQMVSILNQKRLAILSDTGAHFIDLKTGKSLLDYVWQHQGYRALQPLVLDGNRIVIPTGMGSGTRLIEIAEAEGKWSAKDLWTSRFMKPDFNDLVAHQGYLYGFDDSIFACIDLENGKQKWKGGRYGKGQVLLLSDSGLLVVISEQGELVLLRATPEKFTELAKIPSMDGKTWNHPVLVGDRLYLRNAEEAICYQLAIDNKSKLEEAPSP